MSDLKLQFDFIVAKIIRNGETIVPRGHVRLEENDSVILCGEQYFDKKGDDLKEFTIGPFNSWVDKKLNTIDVPEDFLIVVIQRADGTIILPQGDTEIKLNDTVVALEGHLV